MDRRILKTLVAAAWLTAPISACDRTPTAPAEPPPASVDALVGRGLPLYGVGGYERAVPRPCPAPGTRDLDFWAGRWNLERDGAVVATSVITTELDGCVVMEDYINDGGVQARSLSAYDAATGRWHQAYQDNLLGNYRLDGTAGGGVAQLSGSQLIYHFGLGAIVERNAVSRWTDNGDGTVRQVIRGTFDGGPEEILFDGLYRPATALDRATPAFFPFCQAVLPGFRELDFWLGTWAVTAESGPEIGSARVRSDLNGCLLQHDFEGSNGYRSRSFLFWDFAEDRWFRTMADNTGAYVQLSGGLQGTAMVLTGIDEGPDGRDLHVRNTLTPTGDGVTETWEISRDGGATWNVAVRLLHGAM